MNLRYDDIYTKPYEDNYEERFRQKWESKKVPRYRLKTIDCGKLVESEIYPIWNNQTKREVQSTYKRSPEEERVIYERRQRKYLRHIINANFTSSDSWITGTFSDERLPADIDSARRLVLNYIRRVKYRANKLGLPPVKAIYAIEMYDIDGEPVRCHAHILFNMSDRDMLEALWSGGGRTQARRLQPDDFGLTGMAMYVIKAETKEKRGRRKRNAYGYTTNLYKPDAEGNAKISDKKITKRQARRMAFDRGYAEERLKKLYPNLRLLDISIYHNELIDGYYITARFHNDFTDECKTLRRRNGKEEKRNDGNPR